MSIPSNQILSFQKSTAEESVEESKETDPDVHHQHFEEDGGEVENEGATLIADRFYVMSKQRAERKPHPISAKAVSFLQQSLYGRHMNRRPGLYELHSVWVAKV